MPKHTSQIYEISQSRSIKNSCSVADMKSSMINERIKKIKSKYGTHADLKLSLNNSCVSTFADDKENYSSVMNCSIVENGQRKEEKGKKIKNRKVLIDEQKIQRLEDINQKITSLLSNLKEDLPSDSFVTEKNYQRDYLASIKRQKEENPIGRLTNFITKSAFESVRQKVRASSVCSSVRSTSKRQNGKISLNSSFSMSKRKENIKEFVQPSPIFPQSQMKKLSQRLCQQIQLDHIFMKYKTQIAKAGNEAKILLQNALKKTNLGTEQCKTIIDWNFEEIDPLFTERNKDLAKVDNLDQLVFQTINSFLKCEDHWARKVCHKFNNKLIDLKDLDIQNKGYFLKQDLTRFISILSKNMYYNRSISLIFKRINKKRNKIVSTSDFINNLC